MPDITATIIGTIFLIILFASPIILIIVITAVITTLIAKRHKNQKVTQ